MPVSPQALMPTLSLSLLSRRHLLLILDPLGGTCLCTAPSPGEAPPGDKNPGTKLCALDMILYIFKSLWRKVLLLPI
jgi:hypothetical protein